MMTEQEILDKYKVKIENSIAALIQKYGLTNQEDVEILSEKYKKNFVTGFYEGISETNIKVAKNMLAQGKSIEEIIEFTDLKKEEIEALKLS